LGAVPGKEAPIGVRQRMRGSRDSQKKRRPFRATPAVLAARAFRRLSRRCRSTLGHRPPSSGIQRRIVTAGLISRSPASLEIASHWITAGPERIARRRQRPKARDRAYEATALKMDCNLLTIASIRLGESNVLFRFSGPNELHGSRTTLKPRVNVSHRSRPGAPAGSWGLLVRARTLGGSVD
jgi:hypothetical protein